MRDIGICDLVLDSVSGGCNEKGHYNRQMFKVHLVVVGGASFVQKIFHDYPNMLALMACVCAMICGFIQMS